jgi:lysyl-tRNA synthetase class 2
MNSDQEWWRPDRHGDRRPALLARGRITAAVRAHFAAEGFLEVECGQIQRSPGNETHLHAIEARIGTPDGGVETRYLHTSPEFAMKKLIAAGETRIFDFARVFRGRERSALHAPEFTMLEWYRAHEPYEALMADCAALMALAARVAGVDHFAFRGQICDPFAAPERLTVAEAFDRFAGIDLLATTPGGQPDRAALANAVARAGVRMAPDDSWADLFTRVMVEKIDPHLGIGRPTILCEYPVAEAALARPKPGDPRVAERFELFACGVELANAFGELTDPVEQRRRFEADMDLKERLYGVRYPIDEALLQALALMPPTSGIALGFDRLMMLATHAPSIDQVLWTPFG